MKRKNLDGFMFTLSVVILSIMCYSCNRHDGSSDPSVPSIAGCWRSDLVDSEWGTAYHELVVSGGGGYIHRAYVEEMGKWKQVADRKGRIDTERGVLIDSEGFAGNDTFIEVHGDALHLKFRSYDDNDESEEVLILKRCK